MITDDSWSANYGQRAWKCTKVQLFVKEQGKEPAKPIRDYARQAMMLDIAIVVGVSLLYWWRQLPGQ